MEKYDYRQHVSDDVRDYISEHYTREELKSMADDFDELGEKLHDKMWTADSVTGNESGISVPQLGFASRGSQRGGRVGFDKTRNLRRGN